MNQVYHKWEKTLGEKKQVYSPNQKKKEKADKDNISQLNVISRIITSDRQFCLLIIIFMITIVDTAFSFKTTGTLWVEQEGSVAGHLKIMYKQ